MYDKEWFKRVVMKEKRRGYPRVEKEDPYKCVDREYIWFFMATPISPFMSGFNRSCRWIYEEQDKYNPKYCDLYFRPTGNKDILVKVESVNNIYIDT